MTKKLPKANCSKASVIVTISSGKQLENNRTPRDGSFCADITEQGGLGAG